MPARREFGAKPLDQRRATEARHLYFDGGVCFTKLVSKAFGASRVEVVIEHHLAFLACCGFDRWPVIGLGKSKRRGDDETGSEKGE